MITAKEAALKTKEAKVSMGINRIMKEIENGIKKAIEQGNSCQLFELHEGLHQEIKEWIEGYDYKFVSNGGELFTISW